MPAMENETEYGIVVVNRFAGLDIEADDPHELIQRAQQKEKVLKADKKAKGVKGGAKTQEKSQVIAMKETVIEDIKKEGKVFNHYDMKSVSHMPHLQPLAYTCFSRTLAKCRHRFKW